MKQSITRWQEVYDQGLEIEIWSLMLRLEIFSRQVHLSLKHFNVSFFFSFFFYIYTELWRGFIFTAVYLCVCLSACLPACEQNSSLTDAQMRYSLTLSTQGLRQNFFSFRVINNWNNLPSHVAEAPSMNLFKSRLDKHFETEIYPV